MDEGKQPAGGGWSDTMRQAGPWLGIGASLAVTVGVALWAGHWVDRRFGTEPLGFLGGAVLGLLGAFYHVYKMYKSFSSRKP